MSARKIISVGFSLASDDLGYEDIESKASLLDWDIVLFRPSIDDEISRYFEENFQGKSSLSTTGSFRMREVLEHWRREIKQAVEAGKTVVVFLPALNTFYVDTGTRTFSGTGRNRQSTRVVTACNNYQAIPGLSTPLVARGSSMKLAPKGGEVLAAYWEEFGSISNYEVLLTDLQTQAAIITKTGDKAVGVVSRSKTSQGSLVLLPNIDFEPDEFFEGDDFDYSSAAHQFAARFTSAIVALDKALRSGSDITPEPAWAAHASFSLAAESRLQEELLEAEKAVEEAQRRKEELAESLTDAGSCRALLYEKGRPLEVAIIDALQRLGFIAANFKESDSEFDVVFESPEGRLIGEAEGKDSKSVNIDKLRQLAMNIQEDFQRDEVTRVAKPVLFGNGFRLLPLDERGDPFSEKCHIAAKASSTALVFTPDLFVVVQYLLANEDSGYAKQCRESLVNGIGRITFSLPPSKASSEA